VLFLAVLLAAWWTTRQPPAVSKGPTVPAATPAAPAASPAAPGAQAAAAGAPPAPSPGHEELVAMPTGTTPAVATGPEQTGIYALRTSPRRQQLIAEFGATTESENAVAAGLRWLARHQAEDGHWGPDCLRTAPAGRCHQNDRCPNEGQNYAVAQSGLALLAFQAGGHYAHNNREHSQVVARGLDWLVAHQADDGAMVTSGRRNDRTYM